MRHPPPAVNHRQTALPTRAPSAGPRAAPGALHSSRALGAKPFIIVERRVKRRTGKPKAATKRSAHRAMRQLLARSNARVQPLRFSFLNQVHPPPLPSEIDGVLEIENKTQRALRVRLLGVGFRATPMPRRARGPGSRGPGCLLLSSLLLIHLDVGLQSSINAKLGL